MTYEELDKAVREHIKENGSVIMDAGVLGDIPRCGAYRKRTYKENGSWFTEYYGCPFPFAGVIDNKVIDKVAFLKRVLMESVKLISHAPWVVLFFGIKKPMKWFASLYLADLAHHRPDYIELCASVREFIRASLAVFGYKPEDEWNEDHITTTEEGYTRHFIYALAMFLQFDTAYRYRFQDAVGSARSIEEAMDILIERERNIGKKWTAISKVLRFVLWIPPIKRFFKQWFEVVNRQEIQFSEADWYLVCRRGGYLFAGLTLEDRIKIAHEIERSKGFDFVGV